MPDELKRFIQAEITLMMHDIGDCRDANSAYFTKKAIKWIEKNAAGFRVKWESEKQKVTMTKCRARRRVAVLINDME
jgi:hypothetical protein